MDTIRVIIENWPKTNHLSEYLPILIAVVAVIISLYSAHLTRKSFIASHRPYVWASNYVVIDQDKKTIIPIPHRVGYRIKNSPAKIIFTEVEISLNNESLFNYKDEHIVRFPDETSEWSFSIGKEDFENIMKRSNADKSKLTRHVSLKYSSLDGGKVYHYELQQTFDTGENQWKDKSQKVS